MKYKAKRKNKVFLNSLKSWSRLGLISNSVIITSHLFVWKRDCEDEHKTAQLGNIHLEKHAIFKMDPQQNLISTLPGGIGTAIRKTRSLDYSFLGCKDHISARGQLLAQVTGFFNDTSYLRFYNGKKGSSKCYRWLFCQGPCSTYHIFSLQFVL